jgi:hypothetical protein
VHHGREAEGRKTLASLRNLSQDHDLIELEFLEIKAQSMFEKRSTAEHFPHLADGSAWSTIKLQFVAAASLFKSKAMLRRVALATITMFFQQWTVRGIQLYKNCNRTQDTDRYSHRASTPSCTTLLRYV